jgi:hypothetical protein
MISFSAFPSLPLSHPWKDRSWRVRAVIAEKFVALQSALPNDFVKLELVPMLVRLLQDPEAEVKTQATNRLPDVGAPLPPADRSLIIITNIIPRISELCTDTFVAYDVISLSFMHAPSRPSIIPTIRISMIDSSRSQYVRIALANVAMQLAPVLGKDKTVEYLLPTFVRLLKDEVCDLKTPVWYLSIVSACLNPDAAKHWPKLLLQILFILRYLSKTSSCSFSRPQNSDVRLSVIAKLDIVQEVGLFSDVTSSLPCQVVGVEQVTNVLVPEIVTMARDPQVADHFVLYLHVLMPHQWRVRLAIIERLPVLAKALGPVAFDAKLTGSIMVCLIL